MGKFKKEIQRQEKLKPHRASEAAKPEESRQAKRKEKRAKAASTAEDKVEQLESLMMEIPSMEDASTQTDRMDSPSCFFCDRSSHTLHYAPSVITR